MRNLLLISLSLLSSVTYAQSNKFTFKLGDQYELPRKTEDLAFFGNDKDGIINLSIKKDELNVIRFDPIKLTQTDDKVIPLDVTRNFNSETLTSFGNGNYFWIHSDWDKSNEQELLYADKIDVQSGKFISNNNTINQTTKISGEGGFVGFVIGYTKVTDKYQYNYSADGKKLLVSYKLKPDTRREKDTYDKVGLVVFDDNMTKQWSGEFTMPYTEAIMNITDYSIDSKGNAYVLAKVYESDKKREKDKESGKAAYTYEVLKFTKDSKDVQHTVIGVGDYFIKEASLIESPTHDMIIASTYSKKSKGNGTDGIFLAMLDQTGNIVKYKNGYYEFPVADLEKFESARGKRKMENKDDYEAPNLKVREIAIQPDGSILIDCEEYYVVIVTETDSQGHTYSYPEYHYEDIVASKINASGEFAWVRKIPKKQWGLGTLTLGYKLVTDGTDYYYLYLDDKKNFDLAEDEVPKKYKDGAKGDLIVSKLDKDGNLSKDVLFATKDEEIKVYPSQFDKINGNQFIGRAVVKRNTFEPLLITVK